MYNLYIRETEILVRDNFYKYMYITLSGMSFNALILGSVYW